MCFLRLTISIFFLWAVCARASWADVSQPGAADGDSPVATIPQVSVSAAADDDWVLLISGELLKGEIIDMYHGELLFDSEILDEVSIDWDDIKEIRTNKPMSLRLNRRETITGNISFKDDAVIVKEADGQTYEVKRDDVVSMVQMSTSELDKWSFELGAGINIQRGNTNETAYSANANIKRETALTRFNLNYLGNYTRTNSATTTSNQLINSYFDYYLDKRIFLRPAFGQYYHDPFQNLDFQGTFGAGVGYQIYESSTLEWEVVAGPIYQLTRYDSVPSGSKRSVGSPGALVATNYSYDITGDLTLDGDYQVVVTERNSGLINAKFNTTLSYEINDLLDINTSLIWNYIADPAQASDGTTPSSSDVSLIFGIGLSY